MIAVGLAGAAAALAAPAPARAGQRVPRVGVVVAVHVNMSDEEAEKVGGEVGDALRAALVVDVVAGSQASRRLPDKGVGELCVSKPKCVSDVGSRLDADQLLFLVVVKLGKRTQIEPTWAAADGSATASRDTVVIEEGASGVGEVIKEAATRLFPDLPVRTAGTGTGAGAGTGTGAGEGVGASGAGETAGAGTAGAGTAGAGTGGGEAGGRGSGGEEKGGRRIGIHMGTWIAGGVAVAALGAGIGFGLAANADKNDLADKGCGDSVRCDDSDVDSLEHKMLAADIFYATAVAAAATAVIIQWRLGGREDDTAASVAVTASPSAILVRGTF